MDDQRNETGAHSRLRFLQRQIRQQVVTILFCKGRGHAAKGGKNPPKYLTELFYLQKVLSVSPYLFLCIPFLFSHARFKDHPHSIRPPLGRYWSQFGHV